MDRDLPPVPSAPPSDGTSWVARLMSGEASPEDHAACARWRLLSAANEEDYQRARQAWAASGDARDRLTARSIRSGYKVTVFAGLVAAVAIMAAVLVLGVFTPAPSLQTQTFASLSAERISVELASGDSLTLNARAELTVEEADGLTTVRLANGEAFFDVVPGKPRAFVVETDRATITVTGTAFEVGQHGDLVSVAVQHGSVRVEGRNEGADPLLLRAGARALVLPDGTLQILADVPPDIVGAWRSGSIVFLDEPIGLVFGRLENYVGTPITVSPDVDPSLRVSATFADSEVGRVLIDLDSSLPIAIEKQATGEFRVHAD